jgi:hypothetical protein
MDQDKLRGSRRSVQRVGIYEPTRLRPNGWSSLEIRILDVSAQGFRAECEALLKLRSWVSLDVPALGPTHAQVLWERDNQFGAEFVRPIDLEACGWTSGGKQGMLARLLVQRAEARRDGNDEHEKLLRDQIARGLPIIKPQG